MEPMGRVSFGFPNFGVPYKSTIESTKLLRSYAHNGTMILTPTLNPALN